METPIRAILFDWEGTLLDLNSTRETFLLVQWQSFLDELLHIPLRKYVNTVLRAYADCGDGEAAYRKAAADLHLPALLGPELHRHARDHQHEFTRLFPGTVNLLRHLHKHFQTGLVAGGRESVLRATLERCGLSGYIHRLGLADTEGTAPLDPQLHLRILRRLGVRADETLFVGDDPELDLRPASLAGLKILWKRTPARELPDSLPVIGVLDDLRDLPHELRDYAGLAAG